MQRSLLVSLAFLVTLFAVRAHAAAPKFVVDAPFKSCEGLVCIAVSLDGAQPRTLMIDTGNAHSTLLAEAARDLGWTLADTERGGKTVSGLWLGGEHRVGVGDDLASASFFVFERALLGKYVPPVDGSLAYDFFKDRVLE